jgi:hypothetical protein
MTAKPFHVEITGERRDTETVMRRLEGGDWKSASTGNSLVAYPTVRTVLRGGRGIYLKPSPLPDRNPLVRAVLVVLEWVSVLLWVYS